MTYMLNKICSISSSCYDNRFGIVFYIIIAFKQILSTFRSIKYFRQM